MDIDRLLVGVLIIGLIGGCTTTMVSSQSKAKTAVSALETYAWGPEPQATLDDPSAEYGMVDARIRRAVEQELGARGYKKATNDRPDFLVTCQVTMQKDPNVDTVKRSSSSSDDSENLPLGAGSTKDAIAHQYRQGLLRLDILDPRGHKLLWQGSARAVISLRATTQQREDRIRDAVHKVLEGFTP